MCVEGSGGGGSVDKDRRDGLLRELRRRPRKQRLDQQAPGTSLWALGNMGMSRALRVQARKAPPVGRKVAAWDGEPAAAGGLLTPQTRTGV